ncbi:MAG: S8 family serine peptidase [Crocinitomicaceae bacterium]|nr:S8 family serine peptidase [Crocinitomicaceae bacterium]
MNKSLPNLFLAFLFGFIGFTAFSQEHTLLLKSGTYTLDNQSDLTWTQDELINDNFYRIIAFNEIPSEKIKKELAQNGIQLLDYLPKSAFFAEISINVDWSALQDATVLPVLKEYKLSRLLSLKEYPHWTLFGEDQIEIIASYFEEIPVANAEKQLLSIGGSLVSANEAQHTMNVRIKLDELNALYGLNSFHYFEALQPEATPENDNARANHRSNVLWTENGNGLKYNGSGVTVMMQDDGVIGPHIDYTGRIDQTNCSGCSTAAGNTHGDHVSGTIMGAGNLDPSNRGMAHGADLLVYGSGNGNYNDVPNLYDNEEVVITSKSYSNGCNSGYTSLARQLDGQIYDRPSLIHVFSAGNNGTSACSPNDYGAGATWGNITGGHKMGKNVVTVGNLSRFDFLANSSSRGPATDGRIKPDICGVGTSVVSTGPNNGYFSATGTSMSCPGVAGVLAQLYEGYKDLNGGNNPESALIKASILNTAEDLGNPGPDFKFGWGRINAGRAFDIISGNQYVNGSIAQGDNINHQITIPAGVAELRVMVYWMDKEASTNANPALVNDINMVVTDPALNAYNPWVLDHTPANVNLNAVRTVDNLNNMEQVTLVNPALGTYNIDLNGFAIPDGPQDYYVVYYFVRDEITVTYPIGGEGIDSGSSSSVRWDAPEGTDDFDIEYSLDNGLSWTLAGSAAPSLRYFNWATPNVVSGLTKVRVTRNGISDESDTTFTLIDVPANLEFDWICPDSANIKWNPVSGATAYEVSMLGVKYMDSIGTTSATNYTFQIPSGTNGWFSVRALGPYNARGERAVAIEKGTNEFNCSSSPPLANFEIDCPAAGTGHCFDVSDLTINAIAGSSYSWYFPGGTPATSTDQNPVVCYDLPGIYDVALVVDNGAGIDSIYSTDAVYVQYTSQLPYFEGFENQTSFLNNDQWSVSNPNNNQAFDVTTDAALSGTKSAKIRNFTQFGNYEDELISGPVDLSVLSPTDIMTLSFRYSYRRRSDNNYEVLKVFITKSCEDVWVQRKTLSGPQLSALNLTTEWFPSTAADWTTVHMTNVTSNYYSGDFRFKFEFESDGGNNLYLDDINLYQGAPSDDHVTGLNELEISNTLLYPNPTDGEINVEFNLNTGGITELSILDITGKQLKSFHVEANAGNNLAFIDVNELSSGVYFLNIKVDGVSQQLRFVIQ